MAPVVDHWGGVDADLDILLIARYVELTGWIVPAHRPARRCGPGRPLAVTDAELVCLAVAQVLLRFDDERRWLRAAAHRVGHLFPRLVCQSEYNRRLRAVGGLMEAALRFLAAATPSSGDVLRLMDGTPVPCGSSRTTAGRSNLFGWAGYGHHWDAKLMLVTAPDGVGTSFGLVNPKLGGEREAVLGMLGHPGNAPTPATTIVYDKGVAGRDFEAALAGRELSIVRPARRDEPDPGTFPNWLRQRVEAIIWTFQGQLGLEDHGDRIPSGLWTRAGQPLLALNAVIWHNRPSARTQALLDRL